MTWDEYFRANLANWNDRVPIHTGPGGYEIDRLVDDRARLSRIVEFDRAYLGDVAGATLLHAQCHIGSDTLSWAKLGATVTGADFSAPALAVARDLATRLGVEARFVECDLYDLPAAVGGAFDIVYTGIGALCWLPDIRRWAEVMAAMVKPGGRFYIREAHPVLWALGEREDDLLVMEGPYFEREAPRRWDDPVTYLGEGEIEHTVTYEWNHGLGEIVTSLIRSGLRIELLDEHRFTDWPALPHMVEEGGIYRLPEHQRDSLPLGYSLLASRPE